MKMYFYLFLALTSLNAQATNLPKNSPISVLSSIETANVEHSNEMATFDPRWVDSLSLSLPCYDVPVPKRTMRLPNAPRNYRNGTHRGLDFFANWGTPVRSVADGIVVRSDLHYEEVPADFRENLLKATTKVGHTPSDIFNSVLLGKSVFLDHGFDLIPGFRTISIYAHLSHIEKEIIPGAVVKRGELLGKSGNTGMRESTIGSKAGSHLHWEMILQKGEQEIYLGKGMSNPELYDMLVRIFN
ncbi:MAG: M23 family metallopeptidase [Candidatus Neomarinimicrobiota bacterium]